ncbi:MAG: hypothetical protein AB7G06_03270 [Bdellovibrionales bacterium]
MQLMQQHAAIVFGENHGATSAIKNYRRIFSAAAQAGASAVYIELPQDALTLLHRMGGGMLTDDIARDPEKLEAFFNKWELEAESPIPRVRDHAINVLFGSLSSYYNVELTSWDMRDKNSRMLDAVLSITQRLEGKYRDLADIDYLQHPEFTAEIPKIASFVKTTPEEVQQMLAAYIKAAQENRYDDYITQQLRSRVLDGDRKATRTIIDRHKGGPIVVIAGLDHSNLVDGRKNDFEEVDLDDALKLVLGQKKVCTVGINKDSFSENNPDYTLSAGGQLRPNYDVLNQPAPAIDEEKLAKKHGLLGARNKARTLKFGSGGGS